MKCLMQNISKYFILVLLSLVSNALIALPNSKSAFNKLSITEMKKFSDYKVKLNTKVTSQNIDLNKMEILELVLLRNSIFAQYNRPFKTPYISKYFKSRTWYKPGSFKSSSMTQTDKDNVKIIRAHEAFISKYTKAQVLKISKCATLKYKFYKNGKLAYTKQTRERNHPYAVSQGEPEYITSGSKVLYGTWSIAEKGVSVNVDGQTKNVFFNPFNNECFEKK